jgi:hypothetical protein
MQLSIGMDLRAPNVGRCKENRSVRIGEPPIKGRSPDLRALDGDTLIVCVCVCNHLCMVIL